MRKMVSDECQEEVGRAHILDEFDKKRPDKKGNYGNDAAEMLCYLHQITILQVLQIAVHEVVMELVFVNIVNHLEVLSEMVSVHGEKLVITEPCIHG